jgi:N-acyl-phosphatidylethanolamine-hydrolysing phospholipase D
VKILFKNFGRPFFMLTFIAAGFAFSLVACTGSFAQQKFYDAAKPHYTETGFKNPPGSPERDFRPFRFINFVIKQLLVDYDQTILPKGHILPSAEIKKQFAATPQDARITWIGHASFLIGLNGLNILTDPQFSERASPFSFVGPKRYQPPAMAISDLPKIDIILISHNHYDSFDEASLKRLRQHSPNVRIVLPLGDGALAKEWGIENFTELDWYDTLKVGDIEFQSTPAIHRANRGLLDVDNSLWQGITITAKIGGKRKKIWFVGDTGFGPLFKQEVAKKIGPVDIALMPNGAFLPRNIMKAVHVSPEEAMQLAKIMGAKTVIPMHWGTFPLGEDLPKEGKARFLAAPAFGIKKVLMRIGETLDLSKL